MSLFKLILIIITVLLLGNSCYKKEVKLPYQLNKPKIISPLSIYIDKDFSEYQEQYIVAAIKTIEYSSNGKLSFIIFTKQNKPGQFKDIIKNDEGINFIWNIDRKDMYHFSKEMLIGKNDWVAYNNWSKSKQDIVFFKNETADLYKTTLHELGHFIGLDHIYDISFMFPSMTFNPGCITKEDAIKICTIYNCSPRETCSFKKDYFLDF